MTVAIGLVCSDGVLVASDSMGSSGMVATRASVKVHAARHLPLIWTAAGSQYVAEEVGIALQGIDKMGADGSLPKIWLNGDLNNIRSSIKGAVHPAVKRSYESALGSPPGQVPQQFASDFLVLGVAAGTPLFLEIAADGQVNWHTGEGFYAVGSGGEFAAVARGLMAHHVSSGALPLKLGQLLAYRVIDTVCSVSASFVGLPVQMAVVNDTGARVLDQAEIDEIGVGVERWKELEADTLRSGPDVDRDKVADDLPTIEGA
jgi:20S proteasome alpha/beta subunit